MEAKRDKAFVYRLINFAKVGGGISPLKKKSDNTRSDSY